MDQPRAPKLYRSARAAKWSLILLAVYTAIAYMALPAFWTVDERHRQNLSTFLTRTVDGIPGDPINIALVGSQEDVIRAFAAAKWHAADPITLKTSLEIGVDVILDRPYRDAPISTLLFEGRRQDLAFEKPSGESPDTRHHTRLWQADGVGEDGRDFWYGAVSYDRGVGVSHYTGEITHHIGPDLDAERAFVIDGLKKADYVSSTEIIDGIGRTDHAVNGGGDPYFTDGMILEAVLSASPQPPVLPKCGGPYFTRKASCN